MVCEKLNVNVVSSRVRYFSDPLKSYPGPGLIQFHLKGNNISKSLTKWVVLVISSQLFIGICMEVSKKMVWFHQALQKSKVQQAPSTGKIYRTGCANWKLGMVRLLFKLIFKRVIHTCAEATFSDNFKGTRMQIWKSPYMF